MQRTNVNNIFGLMALTCVGSLIFKVIDNGEAIFKFMFYAPFS